MGAANAVHVQPGTGASFLTTNANIDVALSTRLKPADTLAVNDLLCIGIWDVRPTGGESLKTVRVDSQGFVSLYYVGQVRIAGKTMEQAEKLSPWAV